MDITSPAGNTYQVIKPLGGTEKFNLYECLLPDGRQCILKIATTLEHNGVLDREAFLLQMMREEVARLEAEYDKVKKRPDSVLNYQMLFPHLGETFIAQDQGGRRINILDFCEIIADDQKQIDLVPLAHITSRDRVRVDPKTSAWMLGKGFKLLVFAHSLGIAVGNLSGENIIVNRDEHFVAVFDWTRAAIIDTGIPTDLARQEIIAVAQSIVAALGGDPETGEIPPDEQDKDKRYAAYLRQLVDGTESDAKIAHTEFYSLVHDLWPKQGFWKYRTYPL